MKKSVKNLIKRIFDHRPVNYVTVNIQTIGDNDWLRNRCALVTGGTSGIGFSIAKAFLNAGANVIITGRSKERIDTAVKLLGAKNIIGLELNNTCVSSFERVLSPILKEKHVDIFVNNAGINYKGMPNAVEKEYDLVMDTNLKGAFFLSQIVGKYFVENRIKGNILNIASASSLRPADSAYTLSKWGIRGLTLGLAKSLGKYGVTVNGIAPGPTATPMLIRDGNANMSLGRIPLGRYITTEEIASMAVVLVSDMGRSVMGDIIYMTGGAALLTYDDVKYSF